LSAARYRLLLDLPAQVAPFSTLRLASFLLFHLRVPVFPASRIGFVYGPLPLPPLCLLPFNMDSLPISPHSPLPSLNVVSQVSRFSGDFSPGWLTSFPCSSCDHKRFFFASLVRKSEGCSQRSAPPALACPVWGSFYCSPLYAPARVRSPALLKEVFPVCSFEHFPPADPCSQLLFSLF